MTLRSRGKGNDDGGRDSLVLRREGRRGGFRLVDDDVRSRSGELVDGELEGEERFVLRGRRTRGRGDQNGRSGTE